MNRENFNTMRNTIQKAFVLFALVAIVNPLWAQTEEEKEEKEGTLGISKVTMYEGAELAVKDANKLSKNPKPMDTIYESPSFDYSIRELKLETPFKVVPIKAAKMKGQPLDKLYQNYVAVGMGTRATPYGEFFHSKTRSRHLNYGIHGRHFSSAANMDDYAHPGYSDNLAEAYLTRFGKSNAFSTNVDYRREAIHYYGFKPNKLDSTITVPKDDDIKQVYNMASAKFNWYKYKPKRKGMDFALGGGYTFFGDAYKNMQHSAELDAFVDFHVKFIKDFDKQRLGFKVKDRFYSNTFDTLSSNLSNVLTVAPYYSFSTKVLRGSIGFAGLINTDTLSEAFIAPDIQLEIEAIRNILYFHMNVDGGIQRHNYMDLAKENPFVGPYAINSYGRKLVGLALDMETSISKKINLNVNFNYENWTDAAFFVTDTNNAIHNTFDIVREDMNLIQLGAALSYQHTDHILVLLDGKYNMYNMESGVSAWHKPIFELGLRGKYNLQDKILINADVIAYGNTMARDFDDLGNQIEVEIKPWVDVNLGAEYRFSKRLGAFVNVNNIAAAKYQRWYNYPVYGFSIMAGASYIF